VLTLQHVFYSEVRKDEAETQQQQVHWKHILAQLFTLSVGGSGFFVIVLAKLMQGSFHFRSVHSWLGLLSLLTLLCQVIFGVCLYLEQLIRKVREFQGNNGENAAVNGGLLPSTSGVVTGVVTATGFKKRPLYSYDEEDEDSMAEQHEASTIDVEAGATVVADNEENDGGAANNENNNKQQELSTADIEAIGQKVKQFLIQSNHLFHSSHRKVGIAALSLAFLTIITGIRSEGFSASIGSNVSWFGMLKQFILVILVVALFVTILLNAGKSKKAAAAIANKRNKPKQ